VGCKQGKEIQMKDVSGIFKEYAQNFVLDEAKFRRIVDVIRDAAKNLKRDTFLRFHIHRKNSSFYETRDIDAVLKDDNAPPKEIKAIYIELYDSSPSPDAIHYADQEKRPIVGIAFVPDKEMRIRLRVSDEDRDWCFVLADELDAQLRRTLKWSAPAFCRSRRFDALVIFVLISGLAIWSTNHLDAGLSPDLKTLTLDNKLDLIIKLCQPSTKMPRWLFGGLVFGMLTGLVILEENYFSKMISWFDRSVFYWGDSRVAYDRLKNRLYIFVWIIGAGLIVALMANFISKKFF
jgi:hypothetical protein